MLDSQVLRSLLLLLLLLPPPALSSRGQCVDETCSYDLQEYHSQMVNLPSHVHERSIAPWSYVQNIDLNRVPQVIQEASCHTSHSCRALEGSFSLETIPGRKERGNRRNRGKMRRGGGKREGEGMHGEKRERE
uniref:Uncharacterized protein n=1 Tax=Periophthalmus magnuspinnatus TaxID=409849 RepID=A0A3B4APS9_9GOBI